MDTSMVCSRCKRREVNTGGKWCESCREGRRRYNKTGSAIRRSPLIVKVNTGNSYMRLLLDMIETSPYRSCKCCGESSPEVLLITDLMGKAIGRKADLHKMKRENSEFRVYCANCVRARKFFGKCVKKANHNG